mmetsp:Transcript_39229/g.101495  ORF Transcript_39229/g.101495 Transcript_39229/m.101495 type:complete len:258 (-) Transcript_39229:2080-2853(-)
MRAREHDAVERDLSPGLPRDQLPQHLRWLQLREVVRGDAHRRLPDQDVPVVDDQLRVVRFRQRGGVQLQRVLLAVEGAHAGVEHGLRQDLGEPLRDVLASLDGIEGVVVAPLAGDPVHLRERRGLERRDDRLRHLVGPADLHHEVRHDHVADDEEREQEKLPGAVGVRRQLEADLAGLLARGPAAHEAPGDLVRQGLPLEPVFAALRLPREPRLLLLMHALVVSFDGVGVRHQDHRLAQVLDDEVEDHHVHDDEQAA